MRDTNLMPENDMQELWELNGRVKAVIAYLKTDAYVKNEKILVMLGDVSKTPDQTISELEKELALKDAIISEIKDSQKPERADF